MASQRIPELNTIASIDLENVDVFVVVDISANETKKISVEEFDIRYVNHDQFQTMFDTALFAKSTNDLSEGLNLYWTQTRFDNAFDLKTTDNLTEGTSNLYFTNLRVEQNTEVAQNTLKRHDAVTLGSVFGGLSLTGQEISNARSNEITDGYLHKDDFTIFKNKMSKNVDTDIDVQQNFTSVQNNVSAVDITNFSFDTAKVRSFEALVTVYIEGSETTPTEWYGVHRLFGLNKGGTWVLEDIPASGINDDHGLTFSIDNNGNVEYTTPDYNDNLGSYYIEGLAQGNIRFRAKTIEYL